MNENFKHNAKHAAENNISTQARTKTQTWVYSEKSIV